MGCIQITPYQPSLGLSKTYRLPRLPSKPCTSYIYSNHHSRSSLKLTAIASINQQCTPVLKYQQYAPVCLFGGKELPKGDNKNSPWNAVQNDMESSKKDKSIEDVLREQIAKGEYANDGGSGRKPPRGRGRGGDDSGESEDGIMNEILQVILATTGFIFLYIYIISGEELTRLAKDYIKFLFGGYKSARLRRAMYNWGKWYKKED